METNKFTNLPNNQQTFDELKNIIKTSKDIDEVFFAYKKQAEILYFYEEYEEVSKILIKLYEEKGSLSDANLKLLIDSLIYANNKSLALYYINIRKETLPQMEMYKNLLDLLLYKKTFNENFYYLLDNLRAYNFDKSVLTPYYLIRLEDAVLNNKSSVIDHYNNINELDLTKEDKEVVDELYFKYLLNNKMSFEQFILNKIGLSKIYFELRLLIRTDMLKRVQIVEAENEKDLDTLSLYRKEIIFKELRDFYEKNNDFRSYDLYKEKYKFVTDEIKKASKKARKQKLNFNKEEPVTITYLKEEKEPLKLPITSEKLFSLLSFTNELSNLSLDLSFFDRLRNIFLLMENYFEFSDILIYDRPKFYHYKKERLYTKNYNISTIESSVPGITATTLDDIVGDVEFIIPNFDIITNKPLTEVHVRQVYSYGIKEGFSITIYQNKRKDIHYDDLVFKTISSIIYYDLKYDNYINNIKDKYNKINDLFNSNFLIGFIYKEELIGTPLFNDMFNLKVNDNLSSLVLKFEPELRVKYNNLLNTLKKGEINSFNIELYYEGKDYLVNHYLNNGYIYGIFTEVTKQVKELKQWQEKAYKDPLSNILTLHEFENTFTNLKNEKASFILIELLNLDKVESLYGKAKKREFFLEFVEITKNVFNDVYLFDQNSIIALLNINDVRAVENKIKKYKIMIDEKRSNILKEQRFNINMGIIRYPINTKERNVNRIYQYLSLSLYKAKTVDKLKGYSYFDFKDYEQDVFETEIIKQIDNLILTESLLLNFTQIVNYKTKNVYAYEVGITSNALNVYEKYYYNVAIKRDMLERLEKYILEQTFKALRDINLETNSYVRLVVNISSKTLNSPNFIAFLAKLYRTYKVPYEVLEVKVNLKSYKTEEANKLKELSDLDIIIGTDNLEYINKDYIKVFHLTSNEDFFNAKTKAYLKYLKSYLDEQEMTFIVYNVDTEKEVEVLSELDISYIRGRTVDKEISYKKLINMLKQ